MAIQVTDNVRKEFRASLLRGLGRVLSGDPGNTITGQPVPDFLAGPEPPDPLGGFQHRGGRAACDRWARRDRASLLPGRDAYFRQLCGPYLAPGGPGEPTTEPPFTGGQCPGVSYDIRGDVFNQTTGAPNPNNPILFGTRTGPLRFVEMPPEVVCTAPDMVQTQAFVEPVNAPQDRVSVRGPGCVRFSTLENLTITRADGLPDECGDPPEDFDAGDPDPSPDPNPGPVGGPVGFPFPDLDITISPSGDVVIDFGDGSPPDVIDPTAPDGGGGGGGVNPGDIGEPGPVGSTGPGGDTDGEAPTGSVLTALKINFASPPLPGEFDRVGNYRGVCYIYMGTSEGVDLDPGGALVRDGQLFLAEKDNLTTWFVSANLGYDLSVTPYYKTVESSGE